jgi:hypothetical protein
MRLPVGLHILVANFRLAAQPKPRTPLAIVWRRGTFTTRVKTTRPEGTLVSGSLGSLAGGRIATGRWTATLFAGKRRVAIARVRIG